MYWRTHGDLLLLLGVYVWIDRGGDQLVQGRDEGKVHDERIGTDLLLPWQRHHSVPTAKHIIEMAAAVLRTPPWRSGSS